MNIINFTKTIVNVSKLHKELGEHSTLGSIYSHFSQRGDDIEIHFTVNLNQSQIDDCTSYINNFVEVSVHDDLYNYLKSEVGPFTQDLLDDIAAENIELGITTSNKTLEVLGFFTKEYTLPGKTRAVCLKDALDTKSLTVVLELIGYLLANPSEYSDLSPYITSARLTEIYNKIAVFLGIPTI